MKRIRIEDEVYDLLSSLKQSPNDSVNQVLRRHMLLDFSEDMPPPKIAVVAMDHQNSRERDRRSNLPLTKK